MADFDYVKVVGRLGITRADGPEDPDTKPDTVWCDSGTVRFEPLLKSTRIVDGVPSPWTAGHNAIDATIDPQGYISLNNSQEVWLIDLGADGVRPKIERNRASYKVTFMDVRAQGSPVSFASFTCHPLPSDLLPEGTDANDITLIAPLLSPTGQLIFAGPTGVAVVNLSVVNDHLIATLSDGSEVDAGELPPGPAGPSNALTIGTVEAGTQAEATISGVSPNQQLNLVLPQGDKGDIGDTGPQGPSGTMTIGTVTTVDSGVPADVQNSGTPEAAILDFSIPQGPQGNPGVDGVDPHPIAVGEYPTLNPAAWPNDTIFIEWTAP